VIIPDGYVSQGKLAQALVYGAKCWPLKGNFDRALSIVRELADRYSVHPGELGSISLPLQGQRQAALRGASI